MARCHREDSPSMATPAIVEQWRAVIARTRLQWQRRRSSSNGALSSRGLALNGKRRRSSSNDAPSSYVAAFARQLEEAVLERRDLVRELEDRDAVVGGE